MVASGQLDFSMRDLARRLGVSHQAPYHHFGDRDAIFADFYAKLDRAAG